MQLKKMAVILVVDQIEPSLKFWTEVLGFEETHRIDGEDKRLGFVMLNQGDLEIHLQTQAVTTKAMPSLPRFASPPASVLYFDVEDIDEMEGKLFALEKERLLEIVIPKHRTFYGSTEIYVRERSGHLVGFAQVMDA